jgi:hypothetical protein
VRGDEGRVICIELVGGSSFALAATNWFSCIDDTWRLIHHQASPTAMPQSAPQRSERVN